MNLKQLIGIKPCTITHSENLKKIGCCRTVYNEEIRQMKDRGELPDTNLGTLKMEQNKALARAMFERGCRVKEIAGNLNLSTGTIRGYLR